MNMSPTELSAVVGLLAALSVASERLVEIIKGIFPSLDQTKTDAAQESRRKLKLHGLAVLAGIVTAVVASNYGPNAVTNLLPHNNQWEATILLGFLASGGSGFWNSILDYVNKLKNPK